MSTAFGVNGTGNDTNQANNNETEDTAYVTPHVDISVTNSDSPDPVAPGGTITYTQSITNGGPDAAPNATFNQSVPSGTTFQSLSAPAGWTCSTPAAGGTGSISCSKTSMAVSETASAEGDSDTSSASPIPVAAAQQVAPIPTVSEWGLLILAALLAIAAAVKMRM